MRFVRVQRRASPASNGARYPRPTASPVHGQLRLTGIVRLVAAVRRRAVGGAGRGRVVALVVLVRRREERRALRIGQARAGRRQLSGIARVVRPAWGSRRAAVQARSAPAPGRTRGRGRGRRVVRRALGHNRHCRAAQDLARVGGAQAACARHRRGRTANDGMPPVRRLDGGEVSSGLFAWTSVLSSIARSTSPTASTSTSPLASPRSAGSVTPARPPPAPRAARAG
jgi:hypothetical protein